MTNPPPPPLDHNPMGWANTGTLRIRTGLFGFAVAEEMHVHCDGRREWRKVFVPRIIFERRV